MVPGIDLSMLFKKSSMEGPTQYTAVALADREPVSPVDVGCISDATSRTAGLISL